MTEGPHFGEGWKRVSDTGNEMQERELGALGSVIIMRRSLQGPPSTPSPDQDRGPERARVKEVSDGRLCGKAGPSSLGPPPQRFSGAGHFTLMKRNLAPRVRGTWDPL